MNADGDIIERLRRAHKAINPLWPLCREAADEIERLRDRNALLEAAHLAREGEIKRLEVALDQIADVYFKSSSAPVYGELWVTNDIARRALNPPSMEDIGAL